jgi:WD40 repeat protein
LTREQPYSIAFDPHSNLLVVGTTTNVYLIDAAAGIELTRIPSRGIVYNVSVSPDGKTLATASLKMIQLWDIAALRKTELGDLKAAACSRLLWNFSQSQWDVLFGTDQPYKPLCENLRPAN